jgi:hypothetical protein
MATGRMTSGPIRYRQDESGNYVYHPNGETWLTQDDAASRNAANQQSQSASYASQLGEVPGAPSYGGTSYGAPSGVRTSGGGVAPSSGIMNSYGSGGGSLPISRGSYEDQQMLQLRAKLNDDAYAKRLAALKGAGVGGIQPGVSGQGGPMGNEVAARNAAFARAKDRAGQTALASLTALQNVMSNRGMSGSTEEARGMSNSLAGGANIINEFSRDELMTDLNRAADIGDRNYQGAITQRGQDAAAKQSLLALINSASSGLY